MTTIKPKIGRAPAATAAPPVRAKQHDCQAWQYHAGMATCAHGFELLPDGIVRRPARVRWLSHRRAIRVAEEKAKAAEIAARRARAGR